MSGSAWSDIGCLDNFLTQRSRASETQSSRGVEVFINAEIQRGGDAEEG